jgi:hypothetical protein
MFLYTYYALSVREIRKADRLLPNFRVGPRSFTTSDTTQPNNSIALHRIAENLNLQRHVCGTSGLTNKVCRQNLQPDVFEYEVTN